MAKQLSPAQVAEKHNRRTKAAITDMQEGVRNVTVAPGQQAAAKQDKLIQNWNESVRSGRWAKNVAAVDLASWQKAMIEKGGARLAAGLDAAQGKVEAFFAELLPYQQTGQQAIEKMPDLTLEDSIARASAWMRHMAGFRKGRSR